MVLSAKGSAACVAPDKGFVSTVSSVLSLKGSKLFSVETGFSRSSSLSSITGPSGLILST